VAAEFGVEAPRLARRRGRDDKMAGVFLARKLSGLKAKDIAAAFGVKPARVSNIVREVESGSRGALVKRIEKLRAKLEPGS
jgi:DNA-directed RNA polymerase specialized sigma24 family protein